LTDGNDVRVFDLAQLPVKEMKLENNSDQARLSIKKGNRLLSYTQILTVYRNVRFVNLSITIESAAEDISLLFFDSILHIRGNVIKKTETVGLFEEGSKVLGQLIYSENRPDNVTVITPENPSGLLLSYNLHGESSAEIEFFASAFSVSNNPEFYKTPETKANYLNRVLDTNLRSYLSPDSEKSEDSKLDFFNYRTALVDWNVSYIAVRELETIPKFAGDPAFDLLFINDEVAVFIVK
jgi:hypothetical protein